jgi:hypothetical protein
MKSHLRVYVTPGVFTTTLGFHDHAFENVENQG